MEVFSQSKIQRQPRTDLICVRHIKTEVGNIKREAWLPRSLKKAVVHPQGEIRQSTEIVGPTKCPVLLDRVRIESPERKVRHMRVTEVRTELKGVFAVQKG